MGAAGRRKRLRKSLKLFHSGQGETGKMSQRLIRVAQPYLNGGDNLDEYRKELSLASTAWNLSLFPPDSREEHMMKSLDLDALEEEDRQLIAQHLRELVRRKERLFPGDRRVIAKLDVLDDLAEIPVCVGYEIDGIQVDTMPADVRGLEAIRPVYTKLKGWSEPTDRPITD